MDISKPSLTSRQTTARGFTLLELMVTLAIAAILGSLAAPALQDMIIKSRLTGVGNQFTGHILRARNAAISHNTCTVMCLSTNTEAPITTNLAGTVKAGSPSCANSGNDWQQGWIVFLKENCINGTQVANSRPVRPEDYLVIKSSIGDSYNLLAQGGSPPTRFFFDASGRPGLNGAGKFDLEYGPSSTLTQNYGFNICVDSVGRTRNISWGQSC